MKRIGLIYRNNHEPYRFSMAEESSVFEPESIRKYGYTPVVWLLEDLTTEPYVAPKPKISDEALRAMADQ